MGASVLFIFKHRVLIERLKRLKRYVANQGEKGYGIGEKIEGPLPTRQDREEESITLSIGVGHLDHRLRVVKSGPVGQSSFVNSGAPGAADWVCGDYPSGHPLGSDPQVGREKEEER